MNWGDVVTEVVEGFCGLAFTILSFLVTYWITKKVKDEKVKGWLLSLNSLVSKAVADVYQTYVENIKGTDAWTKEAQQNALDKALEEINSELPAEIKDWISANNHDIKAYLTELIEAEIANRKAS